MVTLASSVIDRAVKGFRKNAQPDVLMGSILSADTTISFRGLSGGWNAGQRVEIGTETMLVLEVDTGGTDATVVRGWLDTTAADHADQSPIFLAPRLYRADVLDLLNDCLDDMYGRDLFAVGTQDITYNSQHIGYGLDATAMRILRVDGEDDDFSLHWKPIADYYKMDNAPLAEFPTGKAIMFKKAMPAGSRFRVVYTKRFGQITDESEDLEIVAGIQPYMADLLYYFAMNRIMVDEERTRSQIKAAQNHQRAQDVPPFLALRTGEWYQARYEDRVLTARKTLMDENRRVVMSGYGS
jgi:hypothetical protein